ncbi:MerR family transcriptional regulator [Sediminibacterium soli]|uniref:MerR family transcriptional regulator n=1 Tax=Sediminibacterium soli TaxID=2698829 RepID=UPI001F2F2EE5|nr:MerR family transcriptional regulator [Sediminibacterium soli]
MPNTLQQLDLFGMPMESAPQKVRKERSTQPVVIPPKAETVLMPAEPVVMTAVPQVSVVMTEKKVTAMALKPKGKRGRKSFKEIDSEIDLIEVPEEDVLKQKLYYSISEVAGWFKVNTSLLRYWENEFDILQPRKTRKGDRLFRVEDIRNLQLIYFLLRQRKFSIDGAKNYLRNNKKEADTQAKLMDTLTKFKSFLLELKASL